MKKDAPLNYQTGRIGTNKQTQRAYLRLPDQRAAVHVNSDALLNQLGFYSIIACMIVNHAVAFITIHIS